MTHVSADTHSISRPFYHAAIAAAIALGTVFVCACGNVASAQIVASERAQVSQTIDGTLIEIAYSRPTLRGRDDIFDTEVPRDVLWTPGADSATTISFNKDVTVEGVPVPAGRYSVWMITAHRDWEVVLDTVASRFHVPHPKRTPGQITFSVTPDTLARETIQSLVYYFPTVRSDGATLRMQWERTVVDLNIDVKPTRDLTMTEVAAAPYIGRYAVEIHESKYSRSHSFELDLVYRDDHLFGQIETMPNGEILDTYFAPAADQIFNPVWVMNGTIAAVFDDLFFEFVVDGDGQALSFDARADDDEIWMSGRRVGQ